MGDAKQELAKVIARRRLEGGEFSYVLRLGGEPLTGKKAVYTKLKELQPEVFRTIRDTCSLTDESEEAFDTRMLKLVPQLPYEDDAMDVDEGKKRGKKKPEAKVPMKTLSGGELNRVVRVDIFDRKTKADEVEAHFCREFEGVVSVEKAPTQFGTGNQGFHQGYDVTFKENKFASALLEKGELAYNEKKVQTRLLSSVVQEKVMRRQLHQNFQRFYSCIPMENEGRCLMVSNMGRPKDEEIQEFFVGLESQFEGIVSAKQVLTKREGDSERGRLQGVLLTFQSEAALAKFTEQEELKYKGLLLKWTLMTEVLKNLEVRSKKMNFAVDDGPTTQQLAERRIILLRLVSDIFNAEVEAKLRAYYPEAKDVRHCGADKLTIVTFPTAQAASKALVKETACDLFKPVMAMLVSEYLELRGKLMEEESDRLGKTKTKWENIKNSCVTEEGNKILISDPSPSPNKKEDKKKKDEVVKKEKEAPAAVAKPIAPTNPILRKRFNRGSNVFDCFVGVRGFAQHIKNMGKASDMDVCNYFIHNHKDVADVKFFNWTEIVFAKFKSVEAAERFIGLSYHMFYGVDLALHDLVDFLKKKTDHQKEDVAKILLNKKFNKSMLEGKGGGQANGNGATNGTGAGGRQEVELAGFKNKQVGQGIRGLFVENLHLDEEVVGQPNWIKGSGASFKARLQIKLEDSAISYLVKKWNEMEIAVEGDAVTAEVVGGGVRDTGAKLGKRKKNRPAGGKRPKMSLEDY